jgi:hypothetical protein
MVSRVLGLLVLTGGSGCDADEPGPVQVLTGQVDDALYVALVADDRDMVLYACDGTADQVSVVEWFSGPHDGGRFDQASTRTDTHAEGEFETTSGSGTLHLDGAERPFTLTAADGDAGLYFDEVAEGDVEHWGGWIVRDDGSVRGSVLNRRTGGIVAAGNAIPGGQVTVDTLAFAVLRLETPAL